MAYNVVALVKGVLRAARQAEYVEEHLSMYYLTLEVAQVATGIEIALGAEPWAIFRQMNRHEFARTLVAIAQRLNTRKYTKHKRGLARLWQHQGKKPEENNLLSGVYGWFTEGFDTKGLRDAKALIEELCQ